MARTLRLLIQCPRGPTRGGMGFGGARGRTFEELALEAQHASETVSLSLLS